MSVAPGDQLLLSFSKIPSSTLWLQTVTRLNSPCLTFPGSANGGGSSNPCTVSYTIDMKGQDQQWAMFVAELYNDAILYFDTVFQNITWVVDMANDPGFCVNDPSNTGGVIVTGRKLINAKTCTIEALTLKATTSLSIPEISTSTTPPAPSSIVSPTSVSISITPTSTALGSGTYSSNSPNTSSTSTSTQRNNTGLSSSSPPVIKGPVLIGVGACLMSIIISR